MYLHPQLKSLLDSSVVKITLLWFKLMQLVSFAGQARPINIEFI